MCVWVWVCVYVCIDPKQCIIIIKYRQACTIHTNEKRKPLLKYDHNLNLTVNVSIQRYIVNIVNQR